MDVLGYIKTGNFLIDVNKLKNKVIENLDIKFNPKKHMRPMNKFMYNKGLKNLVGAETGVEEGIHSYIMLSTLDIKMLYLIDPYDTYEMDFGLVENRRKHYTALANALNNLKKFNNFRFIFKYAENAVKCIDEKIDFAYIDDNHNYEYVKKAIKLYYPIVKVGGVIGGHDYCPDHPGVVNAVDEFVKENNLNLYQEDIDWWTIKEV